jgi:hypothetical protein
MLLHLWCLALCAINKNLLLVPECDFVAFLFGGLSVFCYRLTKNLQLLQNKVFFLLHGALPHVKASAPLVLSLTVLQMNKPKGL